MPFFSSSFVGYHKHMPEISIQHLSVTYLGKKKEEYPALKDLSLVFPDGQVSAVMGESGSGKTTLLRALSRQLSYDGAIFSNGTDIATLSNKERRLSYVMQEFALYPHLTVFDNLAFPLKLERESYDAITSRVLDMAKELRIEPLLSRKPRQLSTGQIQKVCLGRALIKNPDLIMLDEPLSNVDIREKEDVLRAIARTLEKYQTTAIYITHNLKEAIYISTNVFFLEGGKLVKKVPSKELGLVDPSYVFEAEGRE